MIDPVTISVAVGVAGKAFEAIKKGFDRLIKKILLSKDRDKLKNLDFLSIKQLVTYYQITNSSNQKENKGK